MSDYIIDFKIALEIKKLEVLKKKIDEIEKEINKINIDEIIKTSFCTKDTIGNNCKCIDCVFDNL